MPSPSPPPVIPAACDPCVKEFYRLVELQKKHGRDKLACISLSFDFEGTGKPEDQQDQHRVNEVISSVHDSNATEPRARCHRPTS